MTDLPNKLIKDNCANSPELSSLAFIPEIKSVQIKDRNIYEAEYYQQGNLKKNQQRYIVG